MLSPVSVRWSFGLLVCQQDHTKSMEQISMKLERRMDLSHD